MNEFWMVEKPTRGMNELTDILPLLDGGRRGYVAGSFAAWMTGRVDAPFPNDIDIFATSKIYQDEIAKCLGVMKGCPAELGDLVHRIDCRPFPIQVIQPNPKWLKFPDDLMSDFDLSTCRACLVNESTLIFDEAAGEKAGKLLRINDPLRSLKRVMKYAARGTTFTDWELLKLFRAWEQVPAARKDTFLTWAEAEAFPETQDYTWADENWFEGE